MPDKVKVYSKVLEIHEEEGTTNTATVAFVWPNRRIYYDRHRHAYVRTWQGKKPITFSPTGVTYHGLPLPAGTYYFIVTYRKVMASRW